MGNLGFILLAAALAPFFFFPTIAAFTGRKRSAPVFAVANLLLAAWIFYFLRSMDDSSAPRIPLPGGALLWWLVMLGLALRKDKLRPEAIDEHVVLVPYDDSWPQSFEHQRQRLAGTLSLPAESFEHIGSSAVPGLVAKPVIDMMLGVASLERVHDALSRLGILGYENFGEAGVPGRIYLRLRGDRSFNLHIVERGGSHWANNLAMRDLLRRDAGARERYAAGKQAALAGAGNRLLAYSAAKQPLIEELLAQAHMVPGGENGEK